MRVLVAAASFSSSISGIQRHAFNLVRCLLQRPEISAVELVVAPWQCMLVRNANLPLDARLSIHVAEMKNSSFSRNLWYYWQLPKLATRLRVDLVHLSYPMPMNAAGLPCPAVVTLHDLYPYEIPRNFGFPKVLFNRLVLRQCLSGADAIACVSEATRRRLRDYMPLSRWQKARCIYNSVEPGPDCSSMSPLPNWQGEPFLLCVAQHRSNKNIPLLICSFHRLVRLRQIDSETKLVVVGMTGPETGNIHRTITRCGIERQIHLFEGLSEPQLQWCYKRCEALVAPSVTEGFDLPVAEALLAGCRVVCSDISAHREIGNGHVRFVSLQENAEEALAAAIALTLKGPQKFPALLPQLSPSAIAQQYVDLYNSLVAPEHTPFGSGWRMAHERVGPTISIDHYSIRPDSGGEDGRF